MSEDHKGLFSSESESDEEGGDEVPGLFDGEHSDQEVAPLWADDDSSDDEVMGGRATHGAQVAVSNNEEIAAGSDEDPEETDDDNLRKPRKPLRVMDDFATTKKAWGQGYNRSHESGSRGCPV